MKIGILEVCSKNHYVLVDGWIKVLKYLGYEPILFVDNEVNKLLNYDFEIKKIVKNDNQSMKEYLKQVSIYKLDHLVITSLQSSLIDFFFHFKPDYKFSLTIHNSKTWFLGNKLNSVKNIVKRIIRSKFKKEAVSFFVSSNNMKNFILQNTKVNKDKINIMPFMLFDKIRNSDYLDIKDSNVKKIIYPGIISATRKKYDTFLSLAEQFPEIEFVLLGSVSKNPVEASYSVIDKVKELNLTNIRYFESYISEEEYNKELNEASFIFSELVTTFKKEDYEEVYGITKDTGISYLMIKNSLPLIVNKEFKNLKSLNSATLYFSNILEIQQYINEYNINTDSYIKLLKKAEDNSKSFSIEMTASSLKRFFNEIK